MEQFLQQFPVVFNSLNVGFLQTMKLFFVTLLGALPLGLLLALGEVSRARVLRGAIKVLVWIIRGSPLMIQLLIIYYGPGLLAGSISAEAAESNWFLAFLRSCKWSGGEDGRFTAAAVAFIINYACYFCEIYRGGIQGIPVGQEEAGLVLGMTGWQIFFKVKLLQMIKAILPPISNEIITLVKDTSLARIISLQEVIWAGQAFLKGSQGISGAIWPLFFTGVYYLVANGLLTVGLAKLEKKLSYFR
ncbi:MAG: amino acid ABC transporter permease [Clostridia bacterium]|nr:amino acid ABC transporter permease [Clostridia bacterium]